MSPTLADASPVLSLPRHPPFAFFWLARVATTLATQMQAVAVGWQIYDLTGSAFDLGLVGGVQFLPTLALALVVGHIVDRHDRRLILTLCRAVQMAAIALLALASLSGFISLAIILALCLVLGCAQAFNHTTSNALMPALVPKPLFTKAVALSASANQSATILGPAVGGLLYAFGPSTVYLTCAALALLGTLFTILIRILAAPPRREKVTLTSLFAGLAYIGSRPIVLGAISLDLFAVLLGGATALLPIYARDILLTGPWGLGLLRGAPALGALLISLVLARVPVGHRAGALMFGAVIVYGIATIVFAVSGSFALSLAALAITGAADAISVVIRHSLVQLQTPDAMRGRVGAVNSLFIGASNQLGEFESGVTAAWFGAVGSVLIGGAGTILVVLLWLRLFPALRRVDRLDSAH
jgi:MFS family permease